MSETQNQPQACLLLDTKFPGDDNKRFICATVIAGTLKKDMISGHYKVVRIAIGEEEIEEATVGDPLVLIELKRQLLVKQDFVTYINLENWLLDVDDVAKVIELN